MTDTSPAAIKAWALKLAGDSDRHARDMSNGTAFDAMFVAEELLAHARLYRAVAALADLADGGWRAMDSAPRDGAENEPFLGCVDGVVKPLAVTGDPNVFISLLDTDQTGVGEPVYVIPPRRRGRHMVVTHWRPLPAPPMENDDG